jgi:hypothetical protein
MTITDPEFQNLLPPHTDAELNQLEENCKADPNHERLPPIQVWRNGGDSGSDIIVDGNNQHRIREQLGLKIRSVMLDFDSRDAALRYALDVQFGRRNLTASQRAMAYAALPRMPEGRPGENVANLQRLAELAEAAGVSKRMMSDATKVADKAAPDVAQAVLAGDFSASDAAKIADLPEQEQNQIADEAKRGGTTLSKAAETSGGSSFDRSELTKGPARKAPINGSSVVPINAKAAALESLSRLCRALQHLGLFKKYDPQLSAMMREVKAL